MICSQICQTFSWITTFATSKIYLKEQCCYDRSFGLEKENPTLKNKIGLHTAPIYVTLCCVLPFYLSKTLTIDEKWKGKKFQVALASVFGTVWNQVNRMLFLAPVVFCFLALSICLGSPKCQTCSPWSLVTLRDDDYGNPDKTKTKHVECWFAIVFTILLHTHYIQGNYHTWNFIFNKLSVSSVGCANLDDLLLKVLITFDHSHTLKIEHIEIFMVGWLALDKRKSWTCNGRLKIKKNYM